MVDTGTATGFIHFHSDPETPRRKIDDMLENIQVHMSLLLITF